MKLKQLFLILALSLPLALDLGLGQPARVQAEEPVEINLEPGSGDGESGALSLTDLPQPLQYKVSEVMGQDQSAYHVQKQPSGYRAKTPAQGLTTEFGPDGIAVQVGQARLTLALVGYGYGQHLMAVAPVQPEAEANRVEYRRGTLTEWYVNGPLGLQQGFTLAERPGLPALDREPLTLALALGGEWQVKVEPGGRALTLVDPKGLTLRYGGLYVYDAEGRELPAHFETIAKRDEYGAKNPNNSSFIIHVDDTDAIYPLTIDPLVQQAKLTASDGAVGDEFGLSVAISGDTVVVGVFRDDIGSNIDQGSAYIFVKPGGGWSTMTETAKLTASDGAQSDFFGHSVAISGDTVVVGAYADDNFKGSAYIFVKPGGGWSSMTETAKLTASDGAAGDRFGFSVAISGDTVVVGAYADDIGNNLGLGSAYVFVKPGGGWSTMTETAKLTAAAPSAVGDQFGRSVAISGDTVVVGAIFNDIGNNTFGSAYVFVKPGGGWSTMTETAKLTASDIAARAWFGWSVAISGDTVVVGALFDDIGNNIQQGSAYVFVKPGGGWSTMTETAKLTASDGAAGDLFGSVAISGDTAVVGAYGDESAYVFVKPGGGWSTNTETAKLTASGGVAGDRFGISVAISGDTVVVGANRHDIGNNSDQGSAYVFGLSPDLTVSKANDTGGSGLVDSPFTWTVTVNNAGDIVADFSSGQTILTDNLPNSGATYGPPTVQNVVNVTNSLSIACAIVSSDLSCTANGATVTLDASTGRFEVTIPVTPTGTLQNPRSGGLCRVDPSGVVNEADEANNDCSDTVVIQGNVYLPIIIKE